MSLAKMGLSTVIIDADMGLNNLDCIMGIENKVEFDLNDYLCGRCRLKQCLVPDKHFPNLYTLPVLDMAQKSQFLETFAELVDKLSKVFDYCLIDSPAGVEGNFKMALEAVSEAIVVVTPHLTALRDADKVLSLLDGAGVSVAGVAINRLRGDLVAAKQMLSHEEIEGLLSRRVLACIPESDLINIHSSFKFNRVLKSEESKAFSLMADNLHNGKSDFVDYLSKYKGVFGVVRRALKRRA